MTEHGMHLLYMTEHGMHLLYMTEHGMHLLYMTEHGMNLLYMTEHGMHLLYMTEHCTHLLYMTEHGMHLLYMTEHGVHLLYMTEYNMHLLYMTEHGMHLLSHMVRCDDLPGQCTLFWKIYLHRVGENNWFIKFFITKHDFFFNFVHYNGKIQKRLKIDKYWKGSDCFLPWENYAQDSKNTEI